MEKYYKLISGENFVGIATQHDFRMYQAKNNIVLACEADDAQYIQCDGILYRDIWMSPTTTDTVIYARVDIISISKEEYDVLYESIEKGEDVIIVPPDEPDEPEPEPVYDVTVEFVRDSKVAVMSATCNRLIENGVDVTLSDGETYHFSLTTQDQLNLTTLDAMVRSGQTQIPYHADGELCKFYSAEDITAIVQAAKELTSYHITYFNSLQCYIKSLDSIEEIGAVVYGMPVPGEYQSDVLKAMLAAMGGNDEDEDS